MASQPSSGEGRADFGAARLTGIFMPNLIETGPYLKALIAVTSLQSATIGAALLRHSAPDSSHNNHFLEAWKEAAGPEA